MADLIAIKSRAEQEMQQLRATYGDYEANLLALRGALRSVEHEDVTIKMQCFSKAEAEYMESRLSEAEKMRVWFTWLEFGAGANS